jgi:hypothetical protein
VTTTPGKLTKSDRITRLEVALRGLESLVGNLATWDRRAEDRLAALEDRVTTLEASVSTRDYRVPRPEGALTAAPGTEAHLRHLDTLARGYRAYPGEVGTYMGIQFAEEAPAPVVPSPPGAEDEARRTFLLGGRALTLTPDQHAAYTRLREQGRDVLGALADLGVAP